MQHERSARRTRATQKARTCTGAIPPLTVPLESTTTCVVYSKICACTSFPSASTHQQVSRPLAHNDAPTVSFAIPSWYAPYSPITLRVRWLIFARPSETMQTTTLRLCQCQFARASEDGTHFFHEFSPHVLLFVRDWRCWMFCVRG